MAQEVIELRGHLLDSLILPRVLDLIMAHDACYLIQEMKVGIEQADPSYARILIAHRNRRMLEKLLVEVKRHGAELAERRAARIERATRDGVFPDGFYITTNLPTEVFLNGRWTKVRNPEMDSGLLVSPNGKAVSTVKMADVQKGDRIVIGHEGVRVFPIEAHLAPREFEFMSSPISTEKPKSVMIRQVARLMKEERKAHRPILWVAGPAVVHTGGAPLMEKLIEKGYVQILFAGNALAAHDIENAMMGTSLGISMREGAPATSGHENHLRVINAIRAAGGIRAAVKKRILNSGIMHACIRHKVDFVLAGSIRDDGPLPEVITDSGEARDEMRRRCRRTRLAIMVATLLHSVATGNMLPATTRVICADIQQAAVTKLMDRGTFQTIGLVTDAQPFLQELVAELKIR